MPQTLIGLALLAAASPVSAQRPVPPPACDLGEGLDAARARFLARWVARDTAGIRAMVAGPDFVLRLGGVAAPFQGEAAVTALLRLVSRELADSLHVASCGGRQEGSAWFEQGRWVRFQRQHAVALGEYRAQWRRAGERQWRLAALVWMELR